MVSLKITRDIFHLILNHYPLHSTLMVQILILKLENNKTNHFMTF